MDDITLSELYLRQDPRAVEESLAAYGYYCRRIAMNILAGEREAEICVRKAAQETLEAVGHRQEIPTDLSICLQKQTRRCALALYESDHSAKRGYNLFSDIPEELKECLPSPIPSPSEPSATSKDAPAVGDLLTCFLRKRSKETRDIFICRYFYADSLTEIARRFGINENRIRPRLRKTCRQLSVFLAQEAASAPLSVDELVHGFGCISDDMIRSAHEGRKQTRRLIPWVIAACAAGILAVSFPYLREVINTDLILRDPDWDQDKEQVGDAEIPHKPAEESILGIGSFVSLGGSSGTITAVTDTTVTLTLVKTDDTPLYAAVYDRMGDALACTDPNYKVDGVTIRPGRIKIYVDGHPNPAIELPTAPGTYSLVVDFSAIRKGAYPMEDYIGFFSYIGKNGAPVAAYVSLILPEETTALPEGESVAP